MNNPGEAAVAIRTLSEMASVVVAIRELWDRFELILGRVHYRVVRISPFARRMRGSSGWPAVSRSTAGGCSAGAWQTPFHEIELVEANQDVSLAHSEGTAYSD